MKKTTINDIAQAAGVSAYTVSKALNGKSKISENTRMRIIQLAKEMDYHPNQFAKRMSGREYRIDVIYPQNPVEFYGYWVDGVKRAEKMMRSPLCITLQDQELKRLICLNRVKKKHLKFFKV